MKKRKLKRPRLAHDRHRSDRVLEYVALLQIGWAGLTHLLGWAGPSYLTPLEIRDKLVS